MAVEIRKNKKLSVNGQAIRPRVAPKKTVAKKAKTGKGKATTAPLRANITPGTVLILLAGRFRGKRVVFLKQLDSGLLLVTGPYKINGVPLKRVNQSYVIATSTKIDVSSLTLSAKVDDSLFQRIKESRVKKHTLAKAGETAAPAADKSITAERKALQVEVDKQILPIVKKTQLLTSYLRSFFTLKKGQAPHAMKF